VNVKIVTRIVTITARGRAQRSRCECRTAASRSRVLAVRPRTAHGLQTPGPCDSFTGIYTKTERLGVCQMQSAKCRSLAAGTAADGLPMHGGVRLATAAAAAGRASTGRNRGPGWSSENSCRMCRITGTCMCRIAASVFRPGRPVPSTPGLCATTRAGSKSRRLVSESVQYGA
jgi:hypothetical protein